MIHNKKINGPPPIEVSIFAVGAGGNDFEEVSIFIGKREQEGQFSHEDFVNNNFKFGCMTITYKNALDLQSMLSEILAKLEYEKNLKKTFGNN